MPFLKVRPGGIVFKLVVAIIILMLFSVNSDAGVLLAQDDPEKAVQKTNTAGQPQDVNNPENILPTEQQQKSPESAYFGKKTDRPVSTHKVNYFSLDHWPGNKKAQLKYQISMKFRLLEPNLYVLKYNLFPAYAAYTQKSLWNVGQKSGPFEESNYNPELFLDYPVNAALIGRFKLRSIVISPIEHESNGLSSAQSRSWNRQYVLIKFGLESKEKLEVTNSFLSDKALLYVKLWHASGYSGQDAYLRSIGNRDKFLDYRGQGEVGVSVRNFLWGGSLQDHQMDIRTPVFRDNRKDSYELELRQQIPNMNFALYLQYWYGYGETLLRFDQFRRRGFVGLAFSY
ncbi:MAG TPA: phospholipase A [Nitrospirota bacterium]|nr:phospholipase A [Nitrospirota bacterium]